jgi:hypothetical protein
MKNTFAAWEFSDFLMIKLAEIDRSNDYSPTHPEDASGDFNRTLSFTHAAVKACPPNRSRDTITLRACS